MIYKLGITMEDPRADQNVSGLILYHTFLVLTYLYNRCIRAQIRERGVVTPNQNKADQIFSCTKTTRKSEVVV